MLELWDILDENGNKTGRTVERQAVVNGKKPLRQGEYHLCVYVWIMNDNGELLIAQRTPNKEASNMWECVGGNAIAGDDSLTTALKEVREELGITLQPQKGRILKRFKRDNGSLADVWLFRQNVDIADVVLCPGETQNAMWASCAKINRMVAEGTFVTWKLFTKIEELFTGE